MSALLEVNGLGVVLPVQSERRPVIRDVSFRLEAGEALGVVGESGCGKSMTARAIGGLLPRGAEVRGTMEFDGRSMLDLPPAELKRVRSDEMAIVFQDPRAHINPVRRIGDFLCEALVTRRKARPDEAYRRAVAALADTGVPDAERRMRQYPHELSGGLLQRVMIASALVLRPRVLIADEPTTALDVTTQADVMAIIDELRRERGLALLFITHDLNLAAATCDRTVVMYAGCVIEERVSTLLHDDPLHPYTAALGNSRPSDAAAQKRLRAIGGRPVSAFEAPAGCAFAPRCAFAQMSCSDARPRLRACGAGQVACHRADELRGGLGSSSPEVADA